MDYVKIILHVSQSRIRKNVCKKEQNARDGVRERKETRELVR